MLVLVSVALVLNAAGIAPAQEARAAEPRPEKKICRPVATTGSIMTKRFCLTKSEWADLNDENAKHADMVKEARSRAVDTRAMGDRE